MWPGPMSQTAEGNQAPRIADALLLGLLHGPAELLPISSSGHTTLVPWFLGLPYANLDSEARKVIEVALHAGTAAALLARPPSSPVAGPGFARKGLLSFLTLAPTAAIGFVVRRFVRGNLGTPATVASGLAVGGVALLVADNASGDRQSESQSSEEALLLGVAQSAALWPGVSRSTAMLVTARLMGFAPAHAAKIARDGLVPAAIAATALESAELRSSENWGQAIGPLAAAAGASFLSTLAARPLVGLLERGGRLWPFAIWRLVLSVLTFGRIRSLRKDKPQ